MWAFVYNIILVPVAMGVLYPISAEAPTKTSEHELTGQDAMDMDNHDLQSGGKPGF